MSGAPVDARLAHAWWLRDGRVVRHELVIDTAAMRAALAAAPATAVP